MGINPMPARQPLSNLGEIVTFLDLQRQEGQWVSGIYMEPDNMVSFKFSEDPKEMGPVESDQGLSKIRYQELSSPAGTSVIFIKPHAIAQRGSDVLGPSKELDIVTEVIRG